MSDTIRIQVNKPIPGYQGVVEVQVDAEGTPLLEIWRRRLKDAELDGCCEIVKPEPKEVPVITEDRSESVEVSTEPKSRIRNRSRES